MAVLPPRYKTPTLHYAVHRHIFRPSHLIQNNLLLDSFSGYYLLKMYRY